MQTSPLAGVKGNKVTLLREYLASIVVRFTSISAGSDHLLALTSRVSKHFYSLVFSHLMTCPPMIIYKMVLRGELLHIQSLAQQIGTVSLAFVGFSYMIQ